MSYPHRTEQEFGACPWCNPPRPGFAPEEIERVVLYESVLSRILAPFTDSFLKGELARRAAHRQAKRAERRS